MMRDFIWCVGAISCLQPLTRCLDSDLGADVVRDIPCRCIRVQTCHEKMKWTIIVHSFLESSVIGAFCLFLFAVTLMNPSLSVECLFCGVWRLRLERMKEVFLYHGGVAVVVCWHSNGMKCVTVVYFAIGCKLAWALKCTTPVKTKHERQSMTKRNRAPSWIGALHLFQGWWKLFSGVIVRKRTESSIHLAWISSFRSLCHVYYSSGTPTSRNLPAGDSIENLEKFGPISVKS